MNIGLCCGELFSFIWVDVNFECEFVIVKVVNVKSGKIRYILFNQKVKLVLFSWKLDYG